MTLGQLFGLYLVLIGAGGVLLVTVALPPANGDEWASSIGSALGMSAMAALGAWLVWGA